MRRRTVLLDKPGKKELVVPFTREGEEVEVLGLVMGVNRGEYELNVVVDHRVGKTRGRVEVRGIARGGARVTVNGLIKIEKRAQQVDDFLELRLLILDDKSQAIAEPKLEIEANDVKASHAASVGRVDEEQVYYLMSRGMTRVRAEEMIVEGFLGSLYRSFRSHGKIREYVKA